MNHLSDGQRQLLGEWFRFGMVGVAATLTYVATSLIASNAGAEIYWANLVGYLSSVAISYFGHALVTFRSSQSHRVQVPKFLTISLLTYGLTNLIVYLVAERMGYSFQHASLAVACAIPPVTWLLGRFWVFRES